MEELTHHRAVELARRLSMALMGAVALGAMAAATVGGILYGVSISRQRPEYFSLSVLNPMFHAGEGIRVQKVVVAPEGCIVRMRRWIEMPADHLSAGRAIGQILTDAADPPNADSNVPTPLGSKTGCGDYHEEMTTQGCGVLSGLLPPLDAVSQPVHVCVLPRLPVETK